MENYCGIGCGRKLYSDTIISGNYPTKGRGDIYRGVGGSIYIKKEEFSKFNDPMRL